MNQPIPMFADDYRVNLPPHSAKAEESVLGAMLINGNLVDDVADILTAKDFYQPRNRKIFEAIQAVHNAGIGVDALTVAEKAEGVEMGEIFTLAAGTYSTANIRAHAESIKHKAQERELAQIGSRIIEIAHDDDIPTTQKLSTAQQEVLSVGDDQTTGQLYGDAAIKAWVDSLDAKYRSEAQSGIATGLTALDKRLNGLQPSDLVLIGGRPGMGKSTLAFQIASHVAMNGHGAMIFSLEMARDQIYDKVNSAISGVDLSRLRSGKLLDDDWPKLTNAVSRIKTKPFFVDDRGALHISQIAATARRMHRKKKLDVIVVDYVQLVRGDGDNRTGEVGSVSRALKALAKELDCTVIALTQLNRKLEDRQNKRPKNSDLRESGDLEQDADIILFTYRDEVYNEDSQQAGITEIICGKFRNGEPGTDYFSTQLELSRFTNLEGGYRPAPQPYKKPSKGMDY